MPVTIQAASAATAARYERAPARDRLSMPHSRPLRGTCLFAARYAPLMLHKQAHPNRAACRRVLAGKWLWAGRCSTEVLRDRRSRSTGAAGEVPQAPSNRSAASSPRGTMHEGERYPSTATGRAASSAPTTFVVFLLRPRACHRPWRSKTATVVLRSASRRTPRQGWTQRQCLASTCWRSMYRTHR